MKKISVLLFGIGLLGISFYGLSNNSYYVQLLVNTSVLFIYARITLVAVLVAYAFVPSLRLYITRALLSIGGMMLMCLGLVSVGSPSLLGHANSYMLLGDDLTLIEGGILAVVLSAELPARRSRFMARSFAYVQSLFLAQPRKLIYYSAVSENTTQAAVLFERVLGTATAIPRLGQLVSGYVVANKALP